MGNLQVALQLLHSSAPDLTYTVLTKNVFFLLLQKRKKINVRSKVWMRALNITPSKWIDGTLVLAVGIRFLDNTGELRKIAQEHPREKIVFKVRGKDGSIAYSERELWSGWDSYSHWAPKYPHGKPDSFSYYVEVKNLKPSETYLIEIDTTSIQGQDTSNYALSFA